jgi:hypothetical protein
MPGAVPRVGVPADTRPSLAPPPGSTIIGPAPPGPAVPPGSFPTTPSSPPGFTPTAPGAFGSGYPPASDPYNSSLTPAPAPPAKDSAVPTGNFNSGPSHSVLGSGYQGNVIRAPELRPALPPDVQTVPDLDAREQPRPNSAPALIDPRDKTAMLKRDQRWAVVPAKWPTAASAKTVPSHMQSVAHRDSPQRTSTPDAPPVYDDSGWKSAR